MITFNKRLKALRIQNNLSLQALADKVGISKSSINMYERGEREPGIETLMAFSDFFGVDLNYLTGYSDKSSPSEQSAEDWLYQTYKYGITPAIGGISSASSRFMQNSFNTRVACSSSLSSDEERHTDIFYDFSITAKGEHMTTEKIKEGDLIYLNTKCEISNGDLVIVLIDGTPALKRIYRYPEEKKILLTSENTTQAPLVFAQDELKRISILGKAVSVMSKL